MAALDHDHLVVRVVYTGPPMAGKTQSVRALMPLLKGKRAEPGVLSPGEWHGRTTFFDWADYEGGAYDGKPIRCQILSTPGQVALSSRRELVLRSADAVIMVVSSEPDAIERATQCYEEMAPWLAEAGRRVPIRLILQCNKQDLPGALPPEELAKVLGLPCGDDVFATSASRGKGLRAAFVAGVRRAVERAHVLVSKHLVLEPSELGTGDELFERMCDEVLPFGSMPAPPPSATAEWAALSGDGRSAGREGAPSARPTPAAGRAAANTPARPSAPAGSARSSSGAPRSGLYPASTAASRASVASHSAASQSGSSAEPDSPPAPGSAARPAAASASRVGAASPPVGATSARAASPGAARARLPPSEHGAGGTEPTARAARRASGTSTSVRGVTQPAPRGSSRASPLGSSARERPRADRGEAGRNERATARAANTPEASRALANPTAASPPGTSAPAHEVPAKSSRVTSAAHDASAAAHVGVSPDSEPAAVARGAIVPPPAEPAIADASERELDRAPPRREQGSLDPDGALARAWRPGSGSRPAVMPASVYYTYVPKPAAPNTDVGSTKVAGEAPAPSPSPAASAPRPRPLTPAEAGIVPPVMQRVPGSARPAVMPASAYFAELAALRLLPSADASAKANAATEGASGEVAPGVDATPASRPGEPALVAAPAAAGDSPAGIGMGAAPANAGEDAAASAPPAALANDGARGGLGPATFELEAPRPHVGEGASGLPRSPAATGGAALGPVADQAGRTPEPELLSDRDESSLQRFAPGTGSVAHPAVVPASTWPAWPSLESGQRLDQPGTGTFGSEPALAGASELAPAKPGAPTALRVLQGGSRELGDDALKSSGRRPPLALSSRPAVMPASAWQLSSETAARAAAPAVERTGRRPAVMPASAWREMGAASARSAPPEPEDGSLQPAPHLTALAGAASEPADASSHAETGTTSDVAAATPPASGVTLRAALGETAEMQVPNVPSAAETCADGPLLQRGTAPSILDEPSRAFQVPETPPGLQAFLADPRLRPLPSIGANAASMAASDVASMAASDLASAVDRDGARAASSAPAAAVDIDALDAEWFSPAGPTLPGHARVQAVWRRAAWRALETQLTVHAATLQDARGRWIGELAPGWFARTLASAPDARAGRRAFAQEVLRQRRLARYLSRPRCVVLSEEADRFWVWQVVGRVPTLASVLRASLAARPTPSTAAIALLEASLAFVDARDRFSAARVPLPLSLETLSQQDEKIVYAGLMPDPEALYAEPVGNGDAAFESSLMESWPDAPCDSVAWLEELRGTAAGKLPEPLLTLIRRVVESR